MKAAFYGYPLLLLLIEILHPLVFLNLASAQVVADFALPSSGCVGTPVIINNLTTGGSTYYWNFCSGNPISNPAGTNIGNPGNLLNIPVYMTLVKDGNTCYSFVTNQGSASVVRYNHGPSFNNYPVSWTNLGGFGMLSDTVLGIKICFDQGNWIGFVNNNNRIIRLNFGSSLANTPVAFMLGQYSMLNTAHGIEIIKENGIWIGYLTCSWGDKVVRLNFGSSLLNNPTLTDLGAPGNINKPSNFRIIKENGIWYALIVNWGNNTLTRLNFGASLLNDPIGENIGTACPSITAGGISIIRDCEQTAGFQLNYSTSSSNLIWRLHFPSGIAGPVSGISLGNIGNLSRPAYFSDLFRTGDSLFLYVTNRQNYTLTRLRFLPCTNASVNSSTLYNPPSFSYDQPGTYNVQLIVDEGLPTQVSLCKSIEIIQPRNVSVSIAASDNPVCEGATVSFTATPDNGGDSPIYQWKVNGTEVGINSPTFSYVPTPNDQVNCVLTSSFPTCTTNNPATSNSIIMQINENQNVDIAINASTNPSCSGIEVEFTATPYNEGTSPTYHWMVNGVDAGINSPAFSYIPSNNDQISCVLNSSLTSCTSNNPATSNTIIMQVIPYNTVGVSIGTSTNLICEGVQVLYTATPINEGTSPTYQWKVNGAEVGINAQTFSYFPANNDQVNCILTSSNTNCSLNNPATSNSIIMQVNENHPVDISIGASANPVCEGTPVLFTAMPVNEGLAPVYQWKVNAADAGTNSLTFSYIPSNNDQISCVLNSSLTSCTSNNPATSNTIIMQVIPYNIVGVSIGTSTDLVCEGVQVLYTATPINEGTSPTYQWKVNGAEVGINAQTFSYFPANNDQVNCILTSSSTNCTLNNPATSNSIIMQVNENHPVNISIGASANPVCEGTPVLFTAMPVNEGLAPIYQWKVNDADAGTNSQTFSYIPANSDKIHCVLTSSNTNCILNNPATSTPVFMMIDSYETVGLSIIASANPICSGEFVSFTAYGINAGANPIFEWKVNSISVGENTPEYSFIPINGDQVSCILTSSLHCTENNPATSFPLSMTVNPVPVVTLAVCNDEITIINAQPLKLKGGLPLGGIYSGPGVNSTTGYFSPSAAGIGSKLISYTYQNGYLCSDSKTKTIQVQESPAFNCGQSYTDIRDGKSYPTIPNGTQCWFQKNLNYGEWIPGSNQQSDNCLIEKYCYLDNLANCSNYGGLYQWDEVMAYENIPGSQGLCPPGWHIPTQTDWIILFDANLKQSLTGKPLQNQVINGFRATQSGVLYGNLSWSFQGFATLFWSSNSLTTVKALSHGMNLQNFSASDYYSNHSNAFSVRCIRD